MKVGRGPLDLICEGPQERFFKSSVHGHVCGVNHFIGVNCSSLADKRSCIVFQGGHMSQFCTKCGQPKSVDVQFCTSCGWGGDASSLSKDAMPAEVDLTTLSPESSGSEISETTPVEHQEGHAEIAATSRKIWQARWFRVAASVLLVVGVGAGGLLVGRSSVDTEKIRKVGYDEGREVGYDDGYSAGETSGRASGKQEGYTSGYADGCRNVFSFSDMTADYVVPYAPYSYWDKYPGDYYKSSTSC